MVFIPQINVVPRSLSLSLFAFVGKRSGYDYQQIKARARGRSDIAQIRACLHGGGGPQIGEVTCGQSPHLTCKRDEIKMKDYMDRRVTPPKRVTSFTRCPPPPCKHALNLYICVTSDEVFENPRNGK